MSRARPLGAPMLLAALLTGCGDDATPPDAAAACGVAGSRAGEACAALADCGGAGNAQTVAFCSSCPVRAGTQICAAGVCEPFTASGAIDIGILALPDSAAGARSVMVAALEPVAADGTRLSCAGLLGASCGVVGNPTLNATNARFQNLNPPAAPDVVYPGIGTVSAPGPDKLLLVRATTEVQGSGAVVAEGCVEGIEVPDGGRARVDGLMLEAR